MAATKQFNLKAYSTQQSVDKSLTMIEKLLISFRASNINKRYDPETQTCIAILFIIRVNNMDMPFKLPAKVEPIAKILQKKMPKTDPIKVAQRAEQVAWKLIYEWLHVQFSLIEIQQAELIEIFLPYVYDTAGDQTFYETVKRDGFKALPPIQ